MWLWLSLRCLLRALLCQWLLRVSCMLQLWHQRHVLCRSQWPPLWHEQRRLLCHCHPSLQLQLLLWRGLLIHPMWRQLQQWMSGFLSILDRQVLLLQSQLLSPQRLQPMDLCLWGDQLQTMCQSVWSAKIPSFGPRRWLPCGVPTAFTPLAWASGACAPGRVNCVAHTGARPAWIGLRSMECALAQLCIQNVGFPKKSSTSWLQPPSVFGGFSCFSVSENKDPGWYPDFCQWWHGPWLGGCGCALACAIWCWRGFCCWRGWKRLLSFVRIWLAPSEKPTDMFLDLFQCSVSLPNWIAGHLELRLPYFGAVLLGLPDLRLTHAKCYTRVRTETWKNHDYLVKFD